MGIVLHFKLLTEVQDKKLPLKILNALDEMVTLILFVYLEEKPKIYQ
jgi:hypothetical protein